MKSAMSLEGCLVKVLNDIILSLAWFKEISEVNSKARRRPVISLESNWFELLRAEALRGRDGLDRLGVSGSEDGTVKEDVRKMKEFMMIVTVKNSL